MSQEYKQPQRSRDPEDVPAPDVTIRDPERAQEIDDLLTEIDDILEVNAEVFVRGFVQKGGE